MPTDPPVGFTSVRTPLRFVLDFKSECIVRFNRLSNEERSEVFTIFKELLYGKEERGTFEELMTSRPWMADVWVEDLTQLPNIGHLRGCVSRALGAYNDFNPDLDFDLFVGLVGGYEPTPPPDGEHETTSPDDSEVDGESDLTCVTVEHKDGQEIVRYNFTMAPRGYGDSSTEYNLFDVLELPEHLAAHRLSAVFQVHAAFPITRSDGGVIIPLEKKVFVKGYEYEKGKGFKKGKLKHDHH